MGRKAKCNEELYGDLVSCIKEEIIQQIDEEFTEYKLRCLDDLEYQIELSRNKVIKQIIDDIDITLQREGNYGEPTYVIKIIKANKEEK